MALGLGSNQKAWTVVDQALSSLGNFVAGFYAAHVLSPAEFGVFALLQVSYVLALGVCRSLFSEVALVSETTSTPTRRHLGSIDCVTMAATVGGFIGIATLVATVGASPWVVAIAVLGIGVALIQDAVRLVQISTRNGRAAALNDALWLVALLAAIPVLHTMAGPTAWNIAAVWGLCSAAGLVVGVAATGWRPSIARGRCFAADQPKLGGAFLGEWSIKQGAAQLAIYTLGLIGGITTVAGIRAAQLVLGPLNIMFTGVQLAVVPSLVAMRRSSLPKMRRALRALALALGLSPLLLGIAVVLVPHALLEVLVGDQAKGLATYALPLAVALSATGFMTGSHAGLRVLHVRSGLLLTRLCSSVITIMGGVIGFALGGNALGGLWGLAAGGVLAVALWEVSFAKAYNRTVATETAAGLPA